MALPILMERLAALSAFTALTRALPAQGGRVGVTGLAGSADAVLLATLAAQQPNRLFVVIADQLPEAERWLADVQSVLGDVGIKLYPPREGFGEVEPHAEVAGERVETLEALARGAVRVLITTARAVQERTRLPRALADARLELRRGDVRRLEDLTAHLDAVGFERVQLVEDVAQYSVRGGILDVYGFGMSEPVRLEFWGDELTEIRRFDVATQRMLASADQVLILPVDVKGEAAELRYERATLAELWPEGSLVVIPAGVAIRPELQRTWDEADHHAQLARRRGEDVPSRDELLQSPHDTMRAIDAFPSLEVIGAGTARAREAGLSPAAAAELPDAVADGAAAAEAHAAAEEAMQAMGRIKRPHEIVQFPLRAPEPVERDIARLSAMTRDGTQTIILCDNTGQAERLEELLDARGEGRSPAALVIGVLAGGFLIPPRGTPAGLRVLTDHEIFRRERRIRRSRKYATGTALEQVTALKPGDFVVHLDHGVGIYRGMTTVFHGEATIEVAVIEYEGGDRLNVPLYRLDQVEKYRAAGDVADDLPPPLLHKLGGKKWSAQKERTRSAIHEMTAELLALYAGRRIASRPPHHPDGAWQKQLESSFLFEDTPDQRKATADVKQDMEGAKPMDRLLVGDVGYGKTEIAVRAAFKAIQSGRQVAVLVPTTVLAEQHARTFGDRFADFPVRIAVMSRFQTKKEQDAALVELAKGTVDVVIGTHRLLSPDVKFERLGLIIVDEEHRFGVKHKERLKQLKLETDVLTLTATPIPRTLHQSLAGLRDMTLMQTPPRDRSPVLTFLEPWDDGLIEEGISRELDRGGQVFFVHNRIETILAIADHIKRVVPRARVGVGHGQMKERELEQVMKQFVSGELDVLVSTLIVESGIDVPNANTMFVNRADRLGLAQLYQLRGRVGRSHRRAYCYLIVPENTDEDAERRLRVLEHHTELGAGYRVALKDMELRGAGNLLGPEQSGFVHAVGFDLYLRLLDEAVTRLMRGDAPPPPPPTDVTLDLPSYLPDDYIAAPEVKLDLYRRLGAARVVDQVDELRDEVRDRFGPLPSPADAYFAVARLRLLGAPLGAEGILVHGNEARVNFRADAVPRLKPLAAAFRDVQFQVDVRRVQPLSLKLTRLGGASLLDGLVRALRTISPDAR
ncbi:MAG: transcription-repair coupling factor [Gemmatimonadetes bacterium]|jgi:transcription-repair coupling factor (superfamily II helicase)|nr:transcription-repair coupling factor [Gemmatimonadota bacterium]